MQISINGKEHTLVEAINIEELLTSIGLGDKPVVVELNKQAIFPREYNAHILKDGDKIEIITIAAGG